jgi:hypothetical protein
MEWSKHKIEIKDLQKFYTDYMKVIKKGEIDLDHCYCLYKYKDSSILYFNSIFDFLDNYANIIKFMPLQEFYFCQKINAKLNA